MILNIEKNTKKKKKKREKERKKERKKKKLFLYKIFPRNKPKD